MQDVKVGDVVRLNSGGPDMTATSRQGTHGLSVMWFVAGNISRHVTISVDAVTIVRPKQQ